MESSFDIVLLAEMGNAGAKYKGIWSGHELNYSKCAVNTTRRKRHH